MNNEYRVGDIIHSLIDWNNYYLVIAINEQVRAYSLLSLTTGYETRLLFNSISYHVVSRGSEE